MNLTKLRYETKIFSIVGVLSLGRLNACDTKKGKKVQKKLRRVVIKHQKSYIKKV